MTDDQTNWGEPQEGEATDIPRIGIDVPADGETIGVLDEPACDGSANCRAITHLEGCFASTVDGESLADQFPGGRAALDAMREGIRGEVEDPTRDHDVIGAIRLAMVGASDQHSQIMLIQRLLTYAPDTHPRAVAPTKLLVQAITDEQGQITVPQQA